MKADARTEAGVMSTLNRFIEAIASRNTDSVLSCFAPDPDLVLIGSGVDEKRLGPDELRAHFERDWGQSEAISVELGWTSVSAAGSVAWVAGDAIVYAKASGQEISLPGWFTAVLEHREGGWLLMQFHFSMPNTEQTEGESFPTK